MPFSFAPGGDGQGEIHKNPLPHAGKKRGGAKGQSFRLYRTGP
jgi:hypothetical protein